MDVTVYKTYHLVKSEDLIIMVRSTPVAVPSGLSKQVLLRQPALLDLRISSV